MKRALSLAFAILLFSLSPCYAGILEDLTGQIGDLPQQALPTLRSKVLSMTPRL